MSETAVCGQEVTCLSTKADQQGGNISANDHSHSIELNIMASLSVPSQAPSCGGGLAHEAKL